MTKKGLLLIVLIVLVLSAFKVFNAMVVAYYSSTTEEGPGTEIDDPHGPTVIPEINTEESGGKPSGSEETAFVTGDKIDLIEDGVIPCICGNSDDIYSKDGWTEESNYGHEYRHLLTCVSGNSEKEASFSLEKQYSNMSFDVGLWNCSKDEPAEIIIYSGFGDTKKKIYSVEFKPGDKEINGNVDVSDCDAITIKLYAPDDFISHLVTNGFVLTHK